MGGTGTLAGVQGVDVMGSPLRVHGPPGPIVPYVVGLGGLGFLRKVRRGTAGRTNVLSEVGDFVLIPYASSRCIRMWGAGRAIIHIRKLTR